MKIRKTDGTKLAQSRLEIEGNLEFYDLILKRYSKRINAIKRASSLLLTVALLFSSHNSAFGAEKGQQCEIAPSFDWNQSVNELRQRNLLIPIDGYETEQMKGAFYQGRVGHLHRAVDFVSPRNTPIRAVEDGTIGRLFQSKNGGLTIYQKDPSGQFVYYYAHLESYADGLKDGDFVKRGQVIGYVGTSGNAPPDTPHLHFSISRIAPGDAVFKGQAFDPYEVYTKDLTAVGTGSFKQECPPEVTLSDKTRLDKALVKPTHGRDQKQVAGNHSQSEKYPAVVKSDAQKNADDRMPPKRIQPLANSFPPPLVKPGSQQPIKKLTANKAAMNKAAMNKAAMNKAVMNKAATNKAAMNKAAANKAAKNKAAKNKAAANSVTAKKVKPKVTASKSTTIDARKTTANKHAGGKNSVGKSKATAHTPKNSNRKTAHESSHSAQ